MSASTWAPILFVDAVPVVVERRRVLVDHGARWYSLEAGTWVVWWFDRRRR